MRGLTESRKTRYTRTALQESMLELMREKPAAKITVKELCEKADINRTTFYAHYADPRDLLLQMEGEVLAWAEETVSALLKQRGQREMLQTLEAVFQYFWDNGRHIQALMSEQGDISFQKQLLSVIYARCGIAPLSGKDAASLTKEYQYIFVVNGSVGLIQHWLKSGAKTPAEMARIVLEMASGLWQISA